MPIRRATTPWPCASIRVKGRAVRVYVTLDEILLGEVDRAAAAEQMNRSDFLARAARAFLDRRRGGATTT